MQCYKSNRKEMKLCWSESRACKEKRKYFICKHWIIYEYHFLGTNDKRSFSDVSPLKEFSPLFSGSLLESVSSWWPNQWLAPDIDVLIGLRILLSPFPNMSDKGADSSEFLGEKIDNAIFPYLLFVLIFYQI
jgi:hypothetical protein